MNLNNSLGTSSQFKTKTGSIGLSIDNDISFDEVKVSEHLKNVFTTVASTLD